MNNRKEEKEREENPYHRDHFAYSEDKDIIPVLLAKS